MASILNSQSRDLKHGGILSIHYEHSSQLGRFRTISILVCIKIASILNSQSRVFKHDGAFSNHHEVMILFMKSLARLKDKFKSLV